MKSQSGFTLIEMIIVMVIIGILAAVALPKFVDMESSAHEASINQARGSVKSSMNLIHGQWLLKKTPTIAYSGGTATIVNEYPDSASIVGAAGLGADDYVATVGAGSVFIASKKKPACGFTYTDAPATAGSEPTVSAVAGC